MVFQVGADAPGSFLQNLAQHRRVSPQRGGWANSGEHFLEEFRDLAAADRFGLGRLTQLPLRLLRPPSAHGLPTANHHPHNQRHRHCSGCGKRKLVAPNQFSQAIQTAWWTSHHRLVCEMALHVHRQAARRFITAVAILLQRLHHDPIQLAPQEIRQFARLGLPALRHRGELLA